ncbi:hypothetical protein AGR7C_Lc70012 [Agrobacterium deltaense Zutra 3/1]|uniref:Uncharacterized protein n=1 Tax=Agrobacterium deltaense Zutra 3/1 TaxID=1183427 RepID=A0A1S7RWM1_9HYPH|nr:hypothetical protein AGR7C_Lc70012 [Agrobacterium deltaense Zutra 3/1]
MVSIAGWMRISRRIPNETCCPGTSCSNVANKSDATPASPMTKRICQRFMVSSPVLLTTKFCKRLALRVDYAAQSPVPHTYPAHFPIVRNASCGRCEIRILGGCLIKNLRIRSNCNVSVREETHANACYFCGLFGQRDDSGGYRRSHRS